MGYLELAKWVEARLRRENEGLEPEAPPKGSAESTLSPERVSLKVEVNPALLEAEETLFRLWWRTLPDQAMAWRAFRQYVAYYCREKGLSLAFEEALVSKVADLAGEG
jgi:hypothetical protein